MSAKTNGKPDGLPANWSKWLVVIAIPFSVLFAETWLNTQMLKRDLKKSTVNAQLRRLQDAYDTYNVRIAQLETLDRIELQAPDLGLVSPQPFQIKTIYYVEGEASEAPAPSYMLAEGRGVAPQAPASGEKDSTWFSSDSNQPASTQPMARLREAIAAACASYFGPSW